YEARIPLTTQAVNRNPAGRSLTYCAFNAEGSRRDVRGFHDRVELPRVRALLARTVAGLLPAAERHVVVEAGRRQVHHDEAALGVSFEVAGVPERSRHDPAR